MAREMGDRMQRFFFSFMDIFGDFVAVCSFFH